MIGDRPVDRHAAAREAAEGQGLSKLWARRKIADAEVAPHAAADHARRGRQAHPRARARAHLVTRLTSLVAVDKTPSRPDGAPLTPRRHAAQPAGRLGLRQGVRRRARARAGAGERRADVPPAGRAQSTLADGARRRTPAAAPRQPSRCGPRTGATLPKTATDAELRHVVRLAALLREPDPAGDPAAGGTLMRCRLALMNEFALPVSPQERRIREGARPPTSRPLPSAHAAHPWLRARRPFRAMIATSVHRDSDRSCSAQRRHGARPRCDASVLIGAVLVGQGDWIHAKAMLAQVLLERAFAADPGDRPAGQAVVLGRHLAGGACRGAAARQQRDRARRSSGQALAFGPGPGGAHAGGRRARHRDLCRAPRHAFRFPRRRRDRRRDRGHAARRRGISASASPAPRWCAGTPPASIRSRTAAGWCSSPAGRSTANWPGPLRYVVHAELVEGPSP